MQQKWCHQDVTKIYMSCSGESSPGGGTPTRRARPPGGQGAGVLAGPDGVHAAPTPGGRAGTSHCAAVHRAHAKGPRRGVAAAAGAKPGNSADTKNGRSATDAARSARREDAARLADATRLPPAADKRASRSFCAAAVRCKGMAPSREAVGARCRPACRRSGRVSGATDSSARTSGGAAALAACGGKGVRHARLTARIRSSMRPVSSGAS